MKSGSSIVLTGDRPTGKLHLGHYVGSLANRVTLQEEYDQYVMVADVQALTDNFEHPEKVRSNVFEVMLDNLASGVDPAQTTFFIQSQVPEISELTTYFLNLVTVARLRRNPTVKDEMQQKGFGEDVPAGFLMYPVSQAADILSVKASIVPAGEDQLPMIEQTNEIIEKFNRIYGKTFTEVTPKVSEHARLRGVDGNAKMSKSLDNCIYLSDTPEEIERKVMAMYTDPDHIHVSDPGKVEGNVVFEYLDVFDKDTEEVEKLKGQYREGGLGDVTVKKRLISVLNEEIGPIRERREYLEKHPRYVMELLEKGTETARQAAADTMRTVRERIQLDYFG